MPILLLNSEIPFDLSTFLPIQTRWVEIPNREGIFIRMATNEDPKMKIRPNARPDISKKWSSEQQAELEHQWQRMQQVVALSTGHDPFEVMLSNPNMHSAMMRGDLPLERTARMYEIVQEPGVSKHDIDQKVRQLDQLRARNPEDMAGQADPDWLTKAENRTRRIQANEAARANAEYFNNTIAEAAGTTPADVQRRFGLLSDQQLAATNPNHVNIVQAAGGSGKSSAAGAWVTRNSWDNMRASNSLYVAATHNATAVMNQVLGNVRSLLEGEDQKKLDERESNYGRSFNVRTPWSAAMADLQRRLMSDKNEKGEVVKTYNALDLLDQGRYKDHVLMGFANSKQDMSKVSFSRLGEDTPSQGQTAFVESMYSHFGLNHSLVTPNEVINYINQVKQEYRHDSPEYQDLLQQGKMAWFNGDRDSKKAIHWAYEQAKEHNTVNGQNFAVPGYTTKQLDSSDTVELATRAANELYYPGGNKMIRPYSTVWGDEFQDFTKNQIRYLAARTGNNSRVLFSGDMEQKTIANNNDIPAYIREAFSQGVHKHGNIENIAFTGNFRQGIGGSSAQAGIGADRTLNNIPGKSISSVSMSGRFEGFPDISYGNTYEEAFRPRIHQWFHQQGISMGQIANNLKANNPNRPILAGAIAPGQAPFIFEMGEQRDKFERELVKYMSDQLGPEMGAAAVGRMLSKDHPTDANAQMIRALTVSQSRGMSFGIPDRALNIGPTLDITQVGAWNYKEYLQQLRIMAGRATGKQYWIGTGTQSGQTEHDLTPATLQHGDQEYVYPKHMLPIISRMVNHAVQNEGLPRNQVPIQWRSFLDEPYVVAENGIASLNISNDAQRLLDAFQTMTGNSGLGNLDDPAFQEMITFMQEAIRHKVIEPSARGAAGIMDAEEAGVGEDLKIQEDPNGNQAIAGYTVGTLNRGSVTNRRGSGADAQKIHLTDTVLRDIMQGGPEVAARYGFEGIPDIFAIMEQFGRPGEGFSKETVKGGSEAEIQEILDAQKVFVNEQQQDIHQIRNEPLNALNYDKKTDTEKVWNRKEQWAKEFEAEPTFGNENEARRIMSKVMQRSTFRAVSGGENLLREQFMHPNVLLDAQEIANTYGLLSPFQSVNMQPISEQIDMRIEAEKKAKNEEWDKLVANAKKGEKIPAMEKSWRREQENQLSAQIRESMSNVGGGDATVDIIKQALKARQEAEKYSKLAEQRVGKGRQASEDRMAMEALAAKHRRESWNKMQGLLGNPSHLPQFQQAMNRFVANPGMESEKGNNTVRNEIWRSAAKRGAWELNPEQIDRFISVAQHLANPEMYQQEMADVFYNNSHMTDEEMMQLFKDHEAAMKFSDFTYPTTDEKGNEKEVRLQDQYGIEARRVAGLMPNQNTHVYNEAEGEWERAPIQFTREHYDWLKQRNPRQAALLAHALGIPEEGGAITVKDRRIPTDKVVFTPSAVVSKDNPTEAGFSYGEARYAHAATDWQQYFQSFQSTGNAEKDQPGGGPYDPMNPGNRVELAILQKRLKEEAQPGLPQFREALRNHRTQIAHLKENSENVNARLAKKPDNIGLQELKAKYEEQIASHENALKVLKAQQKQRLQKLVPVIRQKNAQAERIGQWRAHMNNPQTSLRYGHTAYHIMNATIGGRRGDTEDTRKLETMFFSNIKNEYAPNMRTLGSLGDVMGAMERATNHLQRTGKLKRSHIEDVLAALGHSPDNEKFQGLRRLEQIYNFRSPEDTISLNQMLDLYSEEKRKNKEGKEIPSDREHVMGAFTRYPLQPGDQVTLKGKAIGDRTQNNFAAGMRGTIHAMPLFDNNQWKQVQLQLNSGKAIDYTKFYRPGDELARFNAPRGFGSMQQLKLHTLAERNAINKRYEGDPNLLSKMTGMIYLFKGENGQQFPVREDQLDLLNNGSVEGKIPFTLPSYAVSGAQKSNVPILPEDKLYRPDTIGEAEALIDQKDFPGSDEADMRSRLFMHSNRLLYRMGQMFPGEKPATPPTFDVPPPKRVKTTRPKRTPEEIAQQNKQWVDSMKRGPLKRALMEEPYELLAKAQGHGRLYEVAQQLKGNPSLIASLMPPKLTPDLKDQLVATQDPSLFANADELARISPDMIDAGRGNGMLDRAQDIGDRIQQALARSRVSGGSPAALHRQQQDLAAADADSSSLAQWRYSPILPEPLLLPEQAQSLAHLRHLDTLNAKFPPLAPQQDEKPSFPQPPAIPPIRRSRDEFIDKDARNLRGYLDDYVGFDYDISKIQHPDAQTLRANAEKAHRNYLNQVAPFININQNLDELPLYNAPRQADDVHSLFFGELRYWAPPETMDDEDRQKHDEFFDQLEKEQAEKAAETKPEKWADIPVAPTMPPMPQSREEWLQNKEQHENYARDFKQYTKDWYAYPHENNPEYIAGGKQARANRQAHRAYLDEIEKFKQEAPSAKTAPLHNRMPSLAPDQLLLPKEAASLAHLRHLDTLSAKFPPLAPDSLSSPHRRPSSPASGPLLLPQEAASLKEQRRSPLAKLLKPSSASTSSGGASASTEKSASPPPRPSSSSRPEPQEDDPALHGDPHILEAPTLEAVKADVARWTQEGYAQHKIKKPSEDEQLPAIIGDQRAKLIRGGPGGGKTATAISAAMYAMTQHPNLTPENILAVGALNSAKTALNENLNKFIGGMPDEARYQTEAKTFHQMGHSILFKKYEDPHSGDFIYPTLAALGLGDISPNVLEQPTQEELEQLDPKEREIAIQNSQENFIYEALQDMHAISPFNQAPTPPDAWGRSKQISEWQKQRLSPSDPRYRTDSDTYNKVWEKGLQDIARGEKSDEATFVAYNQRKMSMGRVDHDDVIFHGGTALEQMGYDALPENLKKKHIVVADEAQDLTAHNKRLLQNYLLAISRNNPQLIMSYDTAQTQMENLGGYKPNDIIPQLTDLVHRGMGIEPWRYTLTRNFRSDARVVAWNNAILDDPSLHDQEVSPKQIPGVASAGLPIRSTMRKSQPALYDAMLKSMLKTTGVPIQTIRENMLAGRMAFHGVDFEQPGLVSPTQIPAIVSMNKQLPLVHRAARDMMIKEWGISPEQASKMVPLLFRKGPLAHDADRDKKALALHQFPLLKVMQARSLDFLHPHMDITRVGEWIHDKNLASFTRNAFIGGSREFQGGQNHFFAATHAFTSSQIKKFLKTKLGQGLYEESPDDLSGDVRLNNEKVSRKDVNKGKKVQGQWMPPVLADKAEKADRILQGWIKAGLVQAPDGKKVPDKDSSQQATDVGSAAPEMGATSTSVDMPQVGSGNTVETGGNVSPEPEITTGGDTSTRSSSSPSSPAGESASGLSSQTTDTTGSSSGGSGQMPMGGGGGSSSDAGATPAAASTGTSPSRNTIFSRPPAAPKLPYGRRAIRDAVNHPDYFKQLDEHAQYIKDFGAYEKQWQGKEKAKLSRQEIAEHDKSMKQHLYYLQQFGQLIGMTPKKQELMKKGQASLEGRHHVYLKQIEVQKYRNSGGRPEIERSAAPPVSPQETGAPPPPLVEITQPPLFSDEDMENITPTPKTPDPIMEARWPIPASRGGSGETKPTYRKIKGRTIGKWTFPFSDKFVPPVPVKRESAPIKDILKRPAEDLSVDDILQADFSGYNELGALDLANIVNARQQWLASGGAPLGALHEDIPVLRKNRHDFPITPKDHWEKFRQNLGLSDKITPGIFSHEGKNYLSPSVQKQLQQYGGAPVQGSNLAARKEAQAFFKKMQPLTVEHTPSNVQPLPTNLEQQSLIDVASLQAPPPAQENGDADTGAPPPPAPATNAETMEAIHVKKRPEYTKSPIPGGAQFILPGFGAAPGGAGESLRDWWTKDRSQKPTIEADTVELNAKSVIQKGPATSAQDAQDAKSFRNLWGLLGGGSGSGSTTTGSTTTGGSGGSGAKKDGDPSGNNWFRRAGHETARIGSELQYLGIAGNQLTDQALAQGAAYRRATLLMGSGGATGTEGYFDFMNPNAGINRLQRQVPMFSLSEVAQQMQSVSSSMNTGLNVENPTKSILALSAMTGLNSTELTNQLMQITGSAGQGKNINATPQIAGMLDDMYKGNLSALNVGPTLNALQEILPTVQGINLGAPDQTQSIMNIFKAAVGGGMTAQNLPQVAQMMGTLSTIGTTPNLQQQAFLQNLFPNEQLTAAPEMANYQAQQSENAMQVQQLQLRQQYDAEGMQISINNAQIKMEKANLDMGSIQLQAQQVQLQGAQLQQDYNTASYNLKQRTDIELYGDIGQDTSRQGYFNFMRSQMAAGYDPTSPENSQYFKAGNTFGVENAKFYAGVEHQRSDMVLGRSSLLSDAKFNEDMKYLNEQETFYNEELKIRNEQRSFERDWTKRLLDQQQKSLDMQQKALEQQKVIYDLQKERYALDVERNNFENANLELQKSFIPQQIKNLESISSAMQQQLEGKGPLNGGFKTPQEIIRQLSLVKDDSQLKSLIAQAINDPAQRQTLFQLIKDINKQGGFDTVMAGKTKDDKALQDRLNKMLGQGAYADKVNAADIENAFLTWAGKDDNWKNLVATFKSTADDLKTIAQFLQGMAPGMKVLGMLGTTLGPLLMGLAAVLNVLGIGPLLGKGAIKAGSWAATTAAPAVANWGGSALTTIGGGSLLAGGLVAGGALLDIGAGAWGWMDYNRNRDLLHKGGVDWWNVGKQAVPMYGVGQTFHEGFDLLTDPNARGQYGDAWQKNVWGPLGDWFQKHPAGAPSSSNDGNLLASTTGNGPDGGAMILGRGKGIDWGKIGQQMQDNWNSNFGPKSSISIFFNKTIPQGWNGLIGTMGANWNSNFGPKSPIGILFNKTIPDNWNNLIGTMGANWNSNFGPKSPIGKTWNGFIESAKKVIDQGGQDWSDFWQKTLPKWWDDRVKEWKDGIKELPNLPGNIINAFKDGIKNFLNIPKGQSLWDAFQNSIKGFFNIPKGQNLWDAIMSKIGNPFSGGGMNQGGGEFGGGSGAPENFNGITVPHINTQFGQQLWYGKHQGIDFAAAQGTPLREFVGGKVTAAGFHPWGGEVDVALPGGMTERYLHLSALLAHPGQTLQRGAMVGLTGGGTPQSGYGYFSHGSHLHWQLDKGDINHGVNPWPYLHLYGENNVWRMLGASVSGRGRGGAGGFGLDLKPGQKMPQTEDEIKAFIADQQQEKDKAKAQFSRGGVAMRRMTADVAEVEPEAIIPLSRLIQTLSQVAAPSSRSAEAPVQTAVKQPTHVTVSKLAERFELHVHTSATSLDEQAKDALMAQLLDILGDTLTKFNGGQG